MFHISTETIAYWHDKARPKATPADIKLIEDYIGATLPAPYVEFITTHGFVLFPDWFESFEYSKDDAGQTQIRYSGVGHLMRADLVVQGHRIMTAAASGPDDYMPKYPAHYLGIGQDAGQGEILIDLGEQRGRICYWEWNDERWGTVGNDHMGFVANDMYEFINGLKPYDTYL